MESNRGTSSELDAGSGGRGPARSAPRNIYTLYRPVCGGQSQCRVSVCVTGLFTERSFLSPPVQRSFRHVHVALPPSRFALRSKRPVRTGVRSRARSDGVGLQIRPGMLGKPLCFWRVRSLAPHIAWYFTPTHCRLTIPEHEAKRTSTHFKRLRARPRNHVHAHVHSLRARPKLKPVS